MMWVAIAVVAIIILVALGFAWYKKSQDKKDTFVDLIGRSVPTMGLDGLQYSTDRTRTASSINPHLKG